MRRFYLTDLNLFCLQFQVMEMQKEENYEVLEESKNIKKLKF